MVGDPRQSALRGMGAALCGVVCSAPVAAQAVDQDPDEPSPPPRRDPNAYQDQRENTFERLTRRNPRSAADAPSAVTVVRGPIAWDSGARYFSDVLRLVPGVEVQRISATESNVSMRGYSDASSAAQGILCELDGRNVYNEFEGSVLWDQLPVALDDIEQIEAVRGPGSSVYGANAMHGLVRIATRSPLDYPAPGDRLDPELRHDFVSLRADLGTYRSSGGRLTHVHRTGRSGIKTTLLWDDIEHFAPGDGSSRGQAAFDTRFETSFDADRTHTLEVAAGASHQQLDTLIASVEGVPPITFASAMQESFARADYRNGGLRARAAWTGFDTESVPDVYAPAFDTDLDTVDLDLQWELPDLDGHVLTAGAGFRYATFTTDNADVSGGRHGTEVGWTFVQDEFHATETWSWIASARVDVHSTTGIHVSPRVATVWEFLDRQYVRASVGRGYRSPSLRELWFEMPLNVPGLAAPVSFRGNEDLEAESLISYEIGWFGSMGGASPDAGDDQFELGVSVFYNEVDDLVHWVDPDGTRSRITPQNGAGERAYGTEIEGRYVFGPSWAVFANYGFAIRETRGTPEARAGVEDSGRIEIAPLHKGSAGLTFTSQTGFRAMLWAHYYGATELFEQPVDDYVLLNVSVSYGIDLGDARGDVFVRAFNLLDDVHKEHAQGAAYGLLLTAGVAVEW